jgi:hypothetical protein
MWLSFTIAAAIATFTGLSYAELTSMFPKSAAEYVFVKNAFKSNLAAFVAGWLITFVAIVSAGAVATGFAGYLSGLFPQLDPVLSAIALVVVLSIINFIGIRESVWMNTAFTLVELAGLAIIVLAALFFGSFSNVDYYEVPPVVGASFSLSVGAILGAAGLAFFAYFGFENLANISEETKNATRTIPRALMISIAITTAVYIIVALSAIALVGWEELSLTEAPLALAAEKAFGRSGLTALSGIALFATSNTVLMMDCSHSYHAPRSSGCCTGPGQHFCCRQHRGVWNIYRVCIRKPCSDLAQVQTARTPEAIQGPNKHRQVSTYRRAWIHDFSSHADAVRQCHDGVGSCGYRLGICRLYDNSEVLQDSALDSGPG